jgi:hypothetical protein
MANPRYNTQVTQPRGNQARVGKMGGGMMMQRPMYKKGGKIKETIKKGIKKFHEGAKKATIKSLKEGRRDRTTITPRIDKKAGGRIAGAARKAQQHGYYTPDMGMKGGKMYAKGGKVSGKKRIMAVGRGKAKDYPGIKKIMEMNKKGKKRFRDGGSALKPVDKSKNPGLAKLPTEVRNKMGYMKDGGKVKKKGKEDSKNAYQSRRDQMKQPLKRKGKTPSQMKPLKKKPKPGSYDYQLQQTMKPDYKKDGGMTRNTRRMNRLEELGRVDAEKARTRKGKRNLKDEKKRIVRELNR